MDHYTWKWTWPHALGGKISFRGVVFLGSSRGNGGMQMFFSCMYVWSDSNGASLCRCCQSLVLYLVCTPWYEEYKYADHWGFAVLYFMMPFSCSHWESVSLNPCWSTWLKKLVRSCLFHVQKKSLVLDVQLYIQFSKCFCPKGLQDVSRYIGVCLKVLAWLCYPCVGKAHRLREKVFEVEALLIAMSVKAAEASENPGLAMDQGRAEKALSTTHLFACQKAMWVLAKRASVLCQLYVLFHWK